MNRAARFALVATLVLALTGPDRAVAGPAEARAAAAAELEALAPRIEQLKREAAAGRGDRAELERLLGRAQALAAALERTGVARAPAPAAGPDAQELRERADALRDRADKQALLLAEVNRRLAELKHRAELAEGLDALGATADLFADGAAFRPGATSGRAGDAAGAAGAGGPPGATGGTGTSPGTVTPGAGNPSGLVAPAPVLRSAAEPGAGGGAALGEDPTALRRRRAELTRSLAALRAQADALDAEARAAELR